MFKSFGRGGKAHERFVDATEGFADFFSRWVRTTLVSSTAAVLVVAPAVVLLLLSVVGAVFVTQDWMTGAELVPFLLLGPAVAAPMGVVGPRIQQIRLPGRRRPHHGAAAHLNAPRAHDPRPA